MIQPFSLRLDEMALMMNCELTDDPHYAGLEIQVFDDDRHGAGILVFVERRSDRRIDVYHEAGLRLDRSGYGIGGGLGRWEQAVIDPSVVEFTTTGVHVDVGLTDASGRRIEVRIDDRDGRQRRLAALLAPMGAAVEHPTSLPLVWMPRFDLVRDVGREPEVLIDGRRAATGRLPGAALHRRRLIKVAEDLCAVWVNPAQDGPLSPSGPGPGVVVASAGEHEARLELTPPLDLESMAPRSSVEGSWTVGVDAAPALTGGTWRATRQDGTVRLVMEVTRRWRPRRLPVLMRLVTTVIRTFRVWPTTYRWEAVIELGATPTMRSRWVRTGAGRADDYRRATAR